MTYGTPVTCAKRPAPLTALQDDRDTGWRGTEAAYAERMRAMARAEGHRPGVPATPNSGSPTPLATRILRTLLRHGPMLASDLSNRFHVPRADFAPAMDSLAAEGLVETVPAPVRSAPRREVVALTEAGERRARG